MFKNRFTEILGVRHPIQCGTMMFISSAEFVAACANAGIFSCLASAMFPGEKKLSDEIKKIRKLTDKPFGVNISLFPGLLPMPVEICLEILAGEGVGILETAGNNPAPHRQLIKDYKFLHVHKCARLRDALKAEALGVDLVALVGTECGGHPSMEDVTSLVLVPEASSRLKIPLIAGGGFCDGKTLVAGLALGAEGILMGTRFLNTVEAPIHPAHKEKFVQAQETDTVVIQRSIGSATRVLKNPWAEKILEMEKKGATLEELLPFIGGRKAAPAWVDGNEEAVFACGQVVGRTKETLSIKELVDNIMTEAEEVRKRIQTL
ncbi:MAG: nitronate monooxygenase [Deltaproteobacteria bacterium]|nr:nitronate monooxygenase [Deltaproteobacteria bacterium]